ncbi:MAG TPA: PAS domain S-box protein [Usitatibacter sp.]|nr:PAS domain S-box protein [Usitatibacter sp.]
MAESKNTLPRGTTGRRLRALQVEEIYRFAPTAAAYSYFGALLTLGVLIDIGDIGRGALWFLWATAVTFFRSICIVSYRRRPPDSDPEPWARLVILANFLAGVQWGVLGTVLFPDGQVYLQLFTLMVIICFVAGAVTAYAPVKGAHEALAIPSAIPTAFYLFFVQTGPHWYAGVLAIFFCFTILYYAGKLTRNMEEAFRLQIERDDLLALTELLNEKLERENRDLAHRAAVRGASVESARERADRLEALFERSALPQIECDAAGNVIVCNPAAEKLFGLRHDEVAGRSLTTLLAVPESDVKSLAFAPHAEIFEVEARARDGVRVPCRASFTPLPQVEGRPPGFGVVLTGIPVIIA